MSPVFRDHPKERFSEGGLVAARLELHGGIAAFIQIIQQIASPEGFEISRLGKLVLRPEDNQNISVGPPDLLHAWGLSQGNRLAVLIMSGARRDLLTLQPQTD